MKTVEMTWKMNESDNMYVAETSVRMDLYSLEELNLFFLMTLGEVSD